MPKRVKWLPNERVDVTDINYGTTTFPANIRNHTLKTVILDNFPRICDGFRVEIPNQVSYPGQLTVYNGIAIDTSGQIVNNEDSEITSQSTTILANGTYYLEVAFALTDSDTGSRAFWDPTYDNGTYASGDVKPAGREYLQNVSTRQNPTWTIVTPISTSGFAITTNPNSTNIPVAIILVSGGVIASATTFPARTTVKSAVTAGATKLFLTDTRIMPTSFTGTLGVGLGTSESVTVIGNDRANNILTLSVGTANNHTIGERFAVGGVSPTQFLAERTSTTLPVVGTNDARYRFFQGNENNGYTLSQDPYTVSGRSDIQVKDLKDEVDFLSAQIRELKFGASLDSLLGNVSPSSSFSSAPRYFDLAGGVLGAKTNTVSIGDGSTSWGDFNVAQVGSFQAAFTNALAALPANGGIIYLKGSTSPYELTNTTITINKNLVLIGDGQVATVCRTTGTAPVFTINNSALFVHFENLAIQEFTGSTAANAVVCTAVSSLSARNCLLGLGGTAITNFGNFVNCTFSLPAGLGNPLALQLNRTTFTNCSFVNSTNSGTAYCADITGSYIEFNNCLFTPLNAGSTTRVVNVGASTNNVTFNRCTFNDSTTTTSAVYCGNSINRLLIRDCVSNCSNGIFNMTNTDAASDVSIINSYAKANPSAGNINCFYTNNISRLLIDNCRFVQTGTPNVTRVDGLEIGGSTHVKVSNCVFEDFDSAITLINNTDVLIEGCNISTPTGGSRGGYGIFDVSDTNTSNDVSIRKCTIKDMRAAAFDTNTVAGIRFTGVVSNLTIDSCKIDNINPSGTNPFGWGIDLPSATASSEASVINTHISRVYATSTCAAINTSNYTIQKYVNNNIIDIGDSATYTTATSRGINLFNYNDVVISKNYFRAVNCGTTANSRCDSISLGVDTTSSSNRVNISNNDINGPGTVTGATNTSLIGIYNSGANIVIANNNLRANDTTNTNGITVKSDSASFTMSSLLITGNAITVGYNKGIDVSVRNDAVGSLVNISGNSIENSLTGISLNGNSSGTGNNLLNSSIQNNYIRSPKNGASGILSLLTDYVSIMGNNIFLSNVTLTSAAVLTSGDTASISSNVVYTGNMSGASSLNITSTAASICGNRVSSGTATGIGIAAVAGAFVAGNVITGHTTALTLAGTAKSTALKNVNGNTATDPTAFNEIDLNWRG